MKILLYVLLAFGVFCFFSCKRTEKEQLTFLILKSATIIQYTIKGRFMSR